jgi:hypothetical protein
MKGEEKEGGEVENEKGEEKIIENCLLCFSLLFLPLPLPALLPHFTYQLIPGFL